MNEDQKGPEAAGEAPQQDQPAPGEAEKEQKELAWRKSLPTHLQPIAERHGQLLFQLVMCSGAINHGLGLIAGVGRGHPKIEQAIFVLGKNIDFAMQQALGGHGLSVEQFVECRMDVERVAALMDPVRLPPEHGKRSSGGIILDS